MLDLNFVRENLPVVEEKLRLGDTLLARPSTLWLLAKMFMVLFLCLGCQDLQICRSLPSPPFWRSAVAAACE